MREPVESLFPAYSRTAYRAMKLVVGTSMRRLYDVRVEGIEQVPVQGGAILAANHISFLDSFFIPLVVPRRVTFLAKAEYWDSWRTRWFFEAVGQIPVRRGDAREARGALDAGVGVLRARGLLGIYPEGTRSPDGRLFRGRTGVARLAADAEVPVVPVGLAGTREVMPKGRRMPHLSGTVLVRFGSPRRVEVEGPLSLRSFVDELMYDIREMSAQEYVDTYADRASRDQAGDVTEMATAPA